ncbi:hypothetical protein [Arenicella xantha]|uniref:Uncharacterized protein n=1 Tax=Arenicella xantha TaxID=644221 RepID=A0A395JQI1_9GAMM|nr:hypothetical protein [Arenicella xantha]RBP50980.1 hypothetical protein DFR28_102397 [Arenicella xantha]
MNKHTAHTPQKMTPNLGFLKFWQAIGEELGNSKLKINTSASTVRQILAPNSDHREYLSEIIRLSYTRSRCTNLNDAIDLNSVLDVLGETAFELQGQHADDLLDIELLEEIAWVVSERFGAYLQTESTQQNSSNGNSTARIISLSKIKTLQANKYL